MIKNNPIIKSIIVIYAFAYSCLAIYMIMNGVRPFELVVNLYKSIIWVMCLLGLGFCITIVIISASKSFKLNKILHKNTNGRYSTTQGRLPKGVTINKDSISLKNDLPEDVRKWIIEHEATHTNVVELFLNLAGVLKHYIGFVTDNESKISLYAHSMKITQQLLTYSNSGVNGCNTILVNKQILKPTNMRQAYIQFIIDAQLLPLIGIAHDIGKIISLAKNSKTSLYLPIHNKRARIILTNFEAFWRLDSEQRDALLFAIGNYVSLDKCPKMILEKRLVSTSLHGELLVQLLISAHQDATSYEQIDYKPIPTRAESVQEDKDNSLELDDTDDGSKQIVIASKSVTVSKPKSKSKAPYQSNNPILVEKGSVKLFSPPPTSHSISNQYPERIKINNVFKKPDKKPTNKGVVPKEKSDQFISKAFPKK